MIKRGKVMREMLGKAHLNLTGGKVTGRKETGRKEGSHQERKVARRREGKVTC